jgi:ferric-dicitrate binding protein FerR (iron transport regulator)
MSDSTPEIENVRDAYASWKSRSVVNSQMEAYSNEFNEWRAEDNRQAAKVERELLVNVLKRMRKKELKKSKYSKEDYEMLKNHIDAVENCIDLIENA